MKFIYIKSKQSPEKLYEVENWKESGKYISGIDQGDSGYKTFLKFKITKYLDDDFLLLKDPHPPAPLLKPFRNNPSSKNVEEKPEVLFTGFSAADKKNLTEYAKQNNLWVVTSATINLKILCCGSNAGPTKVEKARQSGAYIVGAASFKHFVETGEVLDEWL